MTTFRRTVCTCAAALVLIWIGGAQTAEAACAAPFLITSIDPEGGGYAYVITPGIDGDAGFNGSSITAEFGGSFWALGIGNPEVGVGADNGAFPGLSWMYVYPGFPASILTAWSASLDIDGCIADQAPLGSRCQATVLTDINPTTGDGVFAVITTPDSPVNGDIILLNDGADFVLAAGPRGASDVELDDNGVTATMTIPTLEELGGSLYLDGSAGCASAGVQGTVGLILGGQVYSVIVPSGSPPPAANDLDAWTAESQLTALGDSTSVSVACTTGDVYLAYTVVFDSGFQTGVVTGSSGALSCSDCGNGVIDDGEECDDGNVDPGDGCDENCMTEVCEDDDGDGFGSPGNPVCTGGDEEDCDDNDPNTFPGADELCDGLDNDCDGDVPADEADADGDGFRICDGDCDDADPNTFPGADELCDGLDNDCDGTVPDDEIDNDSDGFAECEGDCDDADDQRFPGQTEACNGIDDDCDGIVPDDELDRDNDGISECEGDCNDDDDTVRPGVPEICSNDVDNNCDGLIGLDDPECEPLLVELESFTAQVTPRGVKLTWVTAVEIDNAGFRLLRAQVRGHDKGGRQMTPISDFILSRGTPFEGAEYSFTDSARQPAGRVLYYLESVDRNGRSEIHGPVQVIVGGGRGENLPRSTANVSR